MTRLDLTDTEMMREDSTHLGFITLLEQSIPVRDSTHWKFTKILEQNMTNLVSILNSSINKLEHYMMKVDLIHVKFTKILEQSMTNRDSTYPDIMRKDSIRLGLTR